MKSRFNAMQREYCNLKEDFEVAFVVKTGWKYNDIIQQEAILIVLNKTGSIDDIYYLEGESSYRDPYGDKIVIIHESMDYYEPPIEEAEWYLELDRDLTKLYRGKQWHEIKKEIYENEEKYNWFDKNEFLGNYDDMNYIAENSRPLIHVFTSALKMTESD